MFGMDIKQNFFDTQKVVNAVDKTTRQVLSKFGAYVRTAARSSIRTRKKVSSPGSPPSSHTGELKRFIWFAYEPATQNVVIGPIKLSSKSGEAPPSLEHGGTCTTVHRGKKKTVKIAARPFMAPAMQRELPKLPDMWRNSVK